MNHVLQSITDYWTAGGPLLLVLGVTAFRYWAYFRRGLYSTHSLRQLAATQAADDDAIRLCARRDLGILAALTAAAPLVGLLGTVLGMVGTFDAVSTLASDTSRGVAGGIRQALVTTQFGLLVAIPGVFGLARLQRLARQVDVVLLQRRHDQRLEKQAA